MNESMKHLMNRKDLHMTKRSFLRSGWVVACVAVGMVGAAFAYEKTSSPMPKEASEVLKKLGELRSYRARFQLEAKEPGGEVFRLSGLLLFQKPRLRRLEIKEVDAAQPSQIVVNDGTVEWQYYPKDGVVYRVLNPPEPSGPHRPFSEAVPGTIRLVRRIAGAESKLRFELEPVAAIAQTAPVPIATMAVEVGERDGLTRRVELLDGQGNAVLTQYFTDVEVNIPLDAKQFVFEPPKEVKVVDIPPPEIPEESPPSPP